MYDVAPGPFDGPGPGTRHHVTQTAWGGPFVVRSNPIGVVLDWLGAFCRPTPAPMTEVTPGVFEFDAAPPADSGLGGIGAAGGMWPDAYGGGLGSGLQQACGPGTYYDSSAGHCVPQAPPAPAPEPEGGCSQSEYQSTLSAVQAASAACNVAQLRILRDKAESCARLTTGDKRRRWEALEGVCREAINSARCRREPEPPGGGTPPPGGGGAPANPQCNTAARTSATATLRAARQTCNQATLNSVRGQAATCSRRAINSREEQLWRSVERAADTALAGCGRRK